MIFPTVAELAEEVGLELLDGATVVLVGLPRSGRTTVVDLVAELLGASALLVHGRTIDAADYRTQLESIEAELGTRVETLGHAELLLDDFGLLMRQTFGHAFQAALRALMVDGPLARRTGALLTASIGDPLIAPGRHGSPLVAHARIRFSPWLSDRDYELVTPDGPERRVRAELCGSNVALLARADAGEGAARGFADLQIHRWLTELSQSDLDLLLAAADSAVPYKPDHDRVAPLLTRVGGTVRLIAAIPQVRLRDARVGPWPAAIRQTADRFALRIGAEPSPLWLDRYLGAHPNELAALIDELTRRIAPKELRLLATTDGVRKAVSNPVALRKAIAAAEAAGLKINWRLVDGPDFVLAHARQLVLPSVGTVYILPPEDRVLGVNALGNEGDALASGADFTIAEAFWSRSGPFAP